jgi:hypothetical protein
VFITLESRADGADGAEEKAEPWGGRESVDNLMQMPPSACLLAFVRNAGYSICSISWRACLMSSRMRFCSVSAAQV